MGAERRVEDPKDVVRTLTPEPERLPGLRSWYVGQDLERFREQLAGDLVAERVPRAKALEMLLAATEVATNAVRHGGGIEEVRVGRVDGRFVCGVIDRGGGFDDPVAGYLPPRPKQQGPVGGSPADLAGRVLPLAVRFHGEDVAVGSGLVARPHTDSPRMAVADPVPQLRPRSKVTGRAMRVEQAAESAVGRSNGIDPVSRAWTDGLRAGGGQRTEKLAELRDLMTRAARHELARRRHWPNAVQGKDRDDLAEEIASDALFAVINKLDSYRGESRFTTWAYAFVINTVSDKLARQARRPLPLTMDDRAWERLPDRLSTDPYNSAEVRDFLRALQTAVDLALNERQRRVFIAVALNDAPIDELAVELGSNRNAIYKTLFDARRKLRAHLEADGHLLPIPRGRPVGEPRHAHASSTSVLQGLQAAASKGPPATIDLPGSSQAERSDRADSNSR